MAYFADFTPYTFIPGLANQKMLNVGWLSRWHKFPTGTVPEEVLATIFVLCKSPVNQTMGFHSCEFCPSSQFGQPVERDGIQLRLGSAEIRVPGRSGVEYACPDLVYHYISDHSYRPPQEFIEAVLELSS